MDPYDHSEWLRQCPDEYRELSIAISKMRSRLNNIWADNGGDDNPEGDSLGHRPMSEFGDMLWQMGVGTALPDNTDCINGRARGDRPICDVHREYDAALDEPDREERRRRFAEVSALSSKAPIIWDERGRGVYMCWNCGRPSVCGYQSGDDAENAPCGW